jgi:branched-chain amino acid transport system substrate-binding protein
MYLLRARARLAAGFLLLACSTAAMAAFESPSDGVYQDRIDWGVMMDLSGVTAGAQVPWVNGFNAYMKKVNEAGGINGRKVNVLVEDDRYDASLDRANYEKLVSQTPVLGISGIGNSSAQVALMPTLRRGKVPILGTFVVSKPGVDPPSPVYYGGYCGFPQMAQVAVGFFTDRFKLKAPKVATVHLDVAGGKEFSDFVDAEVKKRGGEHKALPIKAGAADATPHVLQIVEMKPDFVTVYGVSTASVLLMRTMKQYGLNIPAIAITQLGTPAIYDAMGADVGANYYFVSCFTPGSVDETPGVKEMSTAADKYGFGNFKDDVNYVGGWVVGQMVAEAIARAGPEPTREKLVASLDKGFSVDTKGASSALRYTKDDHRGPLVVRPYNFDYATKRFKAYGQYADYEKFVK